MHLTLHMTTACNMRCSYCYAPPHDGTPMSFDVARQALDLGVADGDGSCGVVFFGGEPLLCKDLITQAIDYARHREREGTGRFHFKMTTNGLALDDAFLEQSVRNDVFIGFSFDGVRAAHDAHRKLPNGHETYDLLLPKLKRLLEVRPYSSVLMCVNPDTAQYLAESVEMLLDLGCRYLVVSLNYAADWDEDSFRVLEKQYRALGKKYVEWTRAERKFYLSPFEVKLSSHINRDCYRAERCELAERQLSVDPRGFLFPCVQFPRAGADSEWRLGHVSTGVDVAAKQRIKAKSEEEKALCRKCAVRERCNHTCGCLNWQTTGSVNEISPVLCRHEQMLIPIADKIGETLYKSRDPLFLHKHYNAAYPVLSLLEDVLDDEAREKGASE